MRGGEGITVIGGGIGGLFAGAFLAGNGRKVTVLEKNPTAGGGLQCFYRDGKIYETGMHIMGGFGSEGTLTSICRYLGILDKLDIEHISPECCDELYYAVDGRSWKIPSGRERFVAELSRMFPEEGEGIRSYVDDIYAMTRHFGLFYLKPSEFNMLTLPEALKEPADEFIARKVGNPVLRELLAYLSPLYGGVRGHSPVYIHALINVLYINGASRFRGGSQQLADALVGVIVENGGRVLCGKEVESLEIRDRRVTAVRTFDGALFEPDTVVSAIHPVELLRMVPDGTFLKVFKDRVNSIASTHSAFSLYIDLEEGAFPYIDHTCYYSDRYGDMWEQADGECERWPRTFMYMTPPDRNQGRYASRLLVHCPMSFRHVEKWVDTAVGRRGADYLEWKSRCAEEILKRLDARYPGFRGGVRKIYSSSPLTIRDYFGTKEGAICGFFKDASSLTDSYLPIQTKVRNLFLTGQNIILHGICGVPLTAIHTAEAILGKNVIVDEINRN